MKNNKAWHMLIDAFLLGAFSSLISVLLMRYAVLFQNGDLSLPVFMTGNEQSHFELVQAVVKEHTFAINEVHHPSNKDIALYQGYLYTNKPPGFAFLSVPVYTVFLHKLLPLWEAKPIPNFLPLVSVILNGASVGLIYLIAVDLGASRWSASFCALITGLSTILLVYAVSFMNHVASVAFLLFTLWTGFRYRMTLKAVFLALTVFSMSYSILLNHSSIVILFPVAFYVLWAIWQAPHTLRPRLVAIAVLAGMIPLTVLAYYNLKCFGSPFATAYSYYQPPPSVKYESPVEAYLGGSVLRGLWGLLFGWGRGMFVYTPILSCAIPGLFVQLRDRRFVRETTVLVMTAVLNVFVFAPYRYWFGGHSIGPRHILPAIVLVALLMYPCLEQLSRWGRVIVASAAFPSVVVHVMLAILSQDTRALAKSWMENEGYRLGNLYTDIIPLFSTTKVNIWGNGSFRVIKLVICIVILLMAGLIGWRGRKDQ